MKGAETTKANLQRGRQASPGTQNVNATPEALPWMSPTAPEAVGKSGLSLVFKCSPAKGGGWLLGGGRPQGPPVSLPLCPTVP